MNFVYTEELRDCKNKQDFKRTEQQENPLIATELQHSLTY